MAAFNFTARLNLAGPGNMGAVVSQIQRQLNSAKLNVNVNINSKNLASIPGQLKIINTELQKVAASAQIVQSAFRGINSALGGATAKQLNSISSAATQTSASIQSVAKQTLTAKQEMHLFGKEMTLAIKRSAAFTVATASIFGVARAISYGVREAIIFEKELTRVAQVTGTSLKSLKGLANEVGRLATTYGTSSSELLDVAQTLAQAGLSLRDTQVALEAIAKASLAPSFTDTKNTVEALIASIGQFKNELRGVSIGAKDFDDVLGSINAVSAAFAVEADDITAAIRRAGAVFAQASGDFESPKQTLNEFIAIFSSVRQTTRENAETIATGLRTIFTRIQRPQTIDFLRQFGVELQDLEGNFVGPYKALELLSGALKNLPANSSRYAQIVEEIGGIRQVSKLIPAIKEFSLAQQALQVAQSGTNSTTEQAAIAQQSLSNQLTKTREEFLKLIRDIAQTEGFQRLANFFIQGTRLAISFTDSIKELLPALTAIAAVRLIPSAAGLVRGFASGIVSTKKHEGGKIQHFARGGLVPGQGNTDSVPANLMPGEFVIRKKAVESIGVENLHRMNYAKGGRVGFTVGGSVDEYEKYIRDNQLIGTGITGKKGQETIAKSFFTKLPGLNPTLYLEAQKRIIAAGGYSSAGTQRSQDKLSESLKGVQTLQLGDLSTPQFGGLFLRPAPGQDRAAIQNVKVRSLGLNAKKRLSNIRGIDDDTRVFGNIEAGFIEAGTAKNLEADLSKQFSRSVLNIVKNYGSGFSIPKTSVVKDIINKSGLEGVTGNMFEAFVSILTNNVKGTTGDNFDLGSSTNKESLEKLFGSVRSPISRLDLKRTYSNDSIVDLFSKAINSGIPISTQTGFLGDSEKGANFSSGQKLSKRIKRALGGGISGKDTVPALLTPGEFVIRKEAADKLGSSALHRLNHADKIQGFNKGGFVGFAEGGELTAGEIARLKREQRTRKRLEKFKETQPFFQVLSTDEVEADNIAKQRQEIENKRIEKEKFEANKKRNIRNRNKQRQSQSNIEFKSQFLAINSQNTQIPPSQASIPTEPPLFSNKISDPSELAARQKELESRDNAIQRRRVLGNRKGASVLPPRVTTDRTYTTDSLLEGGTQFGPSAPTSIEKARSQNSAKFTQDVQSGYRNNIFSPGQSTFGNQQDGLDKEQKKLAGQLARRMIQEKELENGGKRLEKSQKELIIAQSKNIVQQQRLATFVGNSKNPVSLGTSISTRINGGLKNTKTRFGNFLRTGDFAINAGTDERKAQLSSRRSAFNDRLLGTSLALGSVGALAFAQQDKATNQQQFAQLGAVSGAATSSAVGLQLGASLGPIGALVGLLGGGLLGAVIGFEQGLAEFNERKSLKELSDAATKASQAFEKIQSTTGNKQAKAIEEFNKAQQQVGLAAEKASQSAAQKNRFQAGTLISDTIGQGGILSAVGSAYNFLSGTTAQDIQNTNKNKANVYTDATLQSQVEQGQNIKSLLEKGINLGSLKSTQLEQLALASSPQAQELAKNRLAQRKGGYNFNAKENLNIENDIKRELQNIGREVETTYRKAGNETLINSKKQEQLAKTLSEASRNLDFFREGIFKYTQALELANNKIQKMTADQQDALRGVGGDFSLGNVSIGKVQAGQSDADIRAIFKQARGVTSGNQLNVLNQQEDQALALNRFEQLAPQLIQKYVNKYDVQQGQSSVDIRKEFAAEFGNTVPKQLQEAALSQLDKLSKGSTDGSVVDVQDRLYQGASSITEDIQKQSEELRNAINKNLEYREEESNFIRKSAQNRFQVEKTVRDKYLDAEISRIETTKALAEREERILSVPLDRLLTGKLKTERIAGTSDIGRIGSEALAAQSERNRLLNNVPAGADREAALIKVSEKLQTLKEALDLNANNTEDLAVIQSRIAQSEAKKQQLAQANDATFGGGIKGVFAQIKNQSILKAANAGQLNDRQLFANFENIKSAIEYIKTIDPKRGEVEQNRFNVTFARIRGGKKTEDEAKAAIIAGKEAKTKEVELRNDLSVIADTFAKLTAVDAKAFADIQQKQLANIQELNNKLALNFGESFSKSVDKLVNNLHIPETIKMEGIHKVDLVITGAEALKAMEPMLEKLITTKINEANQKNISLEQRIG